MHNQFLKIAAVVAAIFFSSAAQAYVGPGAGVSLIGALWGLIVGVVVAVGVVLFWPIRMMLRKKKAAAAAAAGEDSGNDAGGNA